MKYLLLFFLAFSPFLHAEFVVTGKKPNSGRNCVSPGIFGTRPPLHAAATFAEALPLNWVVVGDDSRISDVSSWAAIEKSDVCIFINSTDEVIDIMDVKGPRSTPKPSAVSAGFSAPVVAKSAPVAPVAIAPGTAKPVPVAIAPGVTQPAPVAIKPIPVAVAFRVFAGETLRRTLERWTKDSGSSLVWLARGQSEPFVSAFHVENAFLPAVIKLFDATTAGGMPIRARYYKANKVLVVSDSEGAL